mmetsp:Transcript_18747/g.54128  ORF Transcript_18747/g.54128 Transcript_18747/m.54128 type:complete len:223 (-) Transcript_18747:233-901(-)
MSADEKIGIGHVVRRRRRGRRNSSQIRLHARRGGGGSEYSSSLRTSRKIHQEGRTPPRPLPSPPGEAEYSLEGIVEVRRERRRCRRRERRNRPGDGLSGRHRHDLRPAEGRRDRGGETHGRTERGEGVAAVRASGERAPSRPAGRIVFPGVRERRRGRGRRRRQGQHSGRGSSGDLRNERTGGGRRPDREGEDDAPGAEGVIYINIYVYIYASGQIAIADLG